MTAEILYLKKGKKSATGAHSLSLDSSVTDKLTAERHGRLIAFDINAIVMVDLSPIVHSNLLYNSIERL